MKLRIHPHYSHLEGFCRSLPAHFANEGVVIREIRNSIKRFEVEGEQLVVKRYANPSAINRLIYGHLRQSKARRAYTHAALLRTRGIHTPQEVACIEIFRWGLLHESYFISLYSEGQPLSEAMARYPDPEAREILDAATHFICHLHKQGVMHDDLNADNIRYRKHGEQLRFEVIDTNRMRFLKRPSDHCCLKNLIRLTPHPEALLYTLRRYSELTGRNPEKSLLLGCLMRLRLTLHQQHKQRLKGSLHREKRG